MNAHPSTTSDVKATVIILQYPMFWDKKNESIFHINVEVTGLTNGNDSDEVAKNMSARVKTNIYIYNDMIYIYI